MTLQYKVSSVRDLSHN